MGIPQEWFIVGTVILVGLALFLFILRKAYTTAKILPPAPESSNEHSRAPYRQRECGLCRPITRHEEQLVSIVREEIEAKAELMNGEERDLYWIIVHALKPFGCFIISPQVALRAFIKTPEEGESWKALGGKHVDFLISERKTSRPLLVVEYHGGLHCGKNGVKRNRVEKSDEIKRILLKQIGIPLVIISALREGEKFNEATVFQQIFPFLNISMDI